MSEELPPTSPTTEDSDLPERDRWHGIIRLAQACTIVLGLAMLVGFGSALHPWADLVSHFVLQQFTVAVALLLTLLIGRRWRWAAVAALLTAISLTRLLPYWIGSPSATEGTDLRVFLANVLTENTRHEAILDAVREADPDIVVLQEVDDVWMQAVKPLQDSWTHTIAVPRPDNFGMAILSRHPFESQRSVYLGSAGVPTLEVEIDLDGTRVLVFATHPIPPLTRRATHQRDEQLEAIAAHLADHELPVVLVGDLNLTMWSSSFRALLRESGLKDSRRGHGVLPSWPTEVPGLLRIPLDHSLVSESIGVSSIRVLPHVGSDHLPVVVELSIPGVE